MSPLIIVLIVLGVIVAMTSIGVGLFFGVFNKRGNTVSPSFIPDNHPTHTWIPFTPMRSPGITLTFTPHPASIPIPEPKLTPITTLHALGSLNNDASKKFHKFFSIYHQNAHTFINGPYISADRKTHCHLGLFDYETNKFTIVTKTFPAASFNTGSFFKLKTFFVYNRTRLGCTTGRYFTTRFWAACHATFESNYTLANTYSTLHLFFQTSDGGPIKYFCNPQLVSNITYTNNNSVKNDTWTRINPLFFDQFSPVHFTAPNHGSNGYFVITKGGLGENTLQIYKLNLELQSLSDKNTITEESYSVFIGDRPNDMFHRLQTNSSQPIATYGIVNFAAQGDYIWVFGGPMTYPSTLTPHGSGLFNLTYQTFYSFKWNVNSQKYEKTSATISMEDEIHLSYSVNTLYPFPNLPIPTLVMNEAANFLCVCTGKNTNVYTSSLEGSNWNLLQTLFTSRDNLTTVAAITETGDMIGIIISPHQDSQGPTSYSLYTYRYNPSSNKYISTPTKFPLPFLSSLPCKFSLENNNIVRVTNLFVEGHMYNFKY